MLLSACLAAALLAAGAEAAASLPPLSLPRIDFLATEIVDVDSPPASDDPLLSRAALEAVAAEAIAWAASHGLLMHAAPSGEAEGEGGGGAAAASRAPRLVHAPFSLFPAAYPAEQLTQASAVLAPLFGQLVDRVGRDVPWLSRTLKGAADSDDFTRQLLRLCAQIQREGEAQGARLAILRSDYMLHEPLGAAEGQLLQVELNTIASSFGALAARVGQLQSVLVQRHPDVRRHVWRQAGSPSALSLPQRMPPSAAVSELAAAMARAHTLYEGDAASILFVVQPDEANALDQVRSQRSARARAAGSLDGLDREPASDMAIEPIRMAIEQRESSLSPLSLRCPSSAIEWRQTGLAPHLQSSGGRRT